MKKIFRLFVTLFLLCVSLGFVNPDIASADFPNRPVGLVIMDHTGNMNGKVYQTWRTVVKWAYHFPNHKIVDDDPKVTKVVNEFLDDGVKISKTSMGDMAEKAEVDVLIIMPVYGCDYHMVNTFNPWDGGDTKYWTDARCQIFIYKKDGDKFSKKNINESGIKEVSDDYDPVDIIKWALCKQVNIMEGRPVIGRDI
ncbi:MAG: hypothetical protein Q4D21_04995 [Phascolarctobacterium sp.]|nr:hypothetical protein [Phascolarctobacterium sp.]